MPTAIPSSGPPLVRSGDVFPDDLQSGVIVPVDKPERWTSFDVVRKLRRLTGVRKIGHAGTLDPLATGLLICCVGRATKQVSDFVGLGKTYVGTMRLGEQTPSYDADTEVTVRRTWSHLSDEAIEQAMQAFVGTLMQVPPMYSAVKVEGRRLYKSARKGVDVAREPRQVHVSAFDFEGREGADVNFRVVCSKGTYVRALAHDLGQLLACGAHLTRLRRTAIGSIPVDVAWTVEGLSERFGERRPATNEAAE